MDWGIQKLDYVENTSSPLVGEDRGEGDMSSIVHPRPHPPPSRGRGLSHIFRVCACLPVGRGDEPVI